MIYRSALFSIALLGCAWAQADWQPLPLNGSEPPYSSEIRVAYDTSRSVLVARVGWANGADQGTWEWDGSLWRQIEVSSVPRGVAMTFDAVRNRTILVESGLPDWFPNGPHPQRLWEWDGRTWTQVSDLRAITNGPPPRERFAFGFDPVSGEAILHGGQATDSPYARLYDTWTWNGSRWLLRTSNSGLPDFLFEGHQHIVTDPLRNRLIMSGGRGAIPPSSAWTWDGTRWHGIGNTRGGAFYPYAGFAFDPIRDRGVNFGGGPTGSGCNQYTMEFDGERWILRNPIHSPPPRMMMPLWFDFVHLRVLAIAGFCGSTPNGDMVIWSYGTDDHPNYSSIGSGCNSAPALALAAADASQPWLGDLFSVELSGEPPNASAWMATGFSDRSWGAVALPLDLSPLGAAGCQLRVEPHVWYAMARTVHGRLRWSLTIPTTSSLIGMSFYNQALVLAPGANPLGALLSNAMHGVIGAR